MLRIGTLCPIPDLFGPFLELWSGSGPSPGFRTLSVPLNTSTRDHKFYTACQSIGRQVICFLLLHGKQTRGHILTKEDQWGSPGTPRKSGFYDWKRPKEGERVALGHFHERVGESPRSDENFGTSGSKIALFVSEIWPFEVGICVWPNFAM